MSKPILVAARLLRGTAARLPSGPWTLTEGSGELAVISPERDPRARGGHVITRMPDTPGNRALLAYLVLMGPPVAMRCAAWLENAAGRWDSTATTREGEHAYALTRAIQNPRGWSDR